MVALGVSLANDFFAGLQRKTSRMRGAVRSLDSIGSGEGFCLDQMGVLSVVIAGICTMKIV